MSKLTKLATGYEKWESLPLMSRPLKQIHAIANLYLMKAPIGYKQMMEGSLVSRYGSSNHSYLSIIQAVIKHLVEETEHHKLHYPAAIQALAENCRM
jgi:hypothetical protein